MSGGRTQISRVLEVEKESLGSAREPWGASKGMQSDWHPNPSVQLLPRNDENWGLVTWMEPKSGSLL